MMGKMKAMMDKMDSDMKQQGSAMMGKMKGMMGKMDPDMRAQCQSMMKRCNAMMDKQADPVATSGSETEIKGDQPVVAAAKTGEEQ